MQGGKQKTKAQERFYDKITGLGCMCCGATDAEVHHPIGTVGNWTIRDTFEKVKCGNWFAYALCPRCHRLDPVNITTRKTKFLDSYRKRWGNKPDLWIEKKIFGEQLKRYKFQYDEEAPVPENMLQAIREYQ